MSNEKSFLINPFHFSIELMDKIVLINFQKDPDNIYIGFEAQLFDDDFNGQGHLIVGWRRDGKVDMYYQSGLTLSDRNSHMSGVGVADIIECIFDVASLDIDHRGVQALYRFTDKYNRKIKIKINEKNYKKRRVFNMLAPMGNTAEFPVSLPLIYLFDFYFVRKNHTVIDIQIDGRSHSLDTLPIPIDGMKMFFTRYSAKPLIAGFNPSLDDHISHLNLRDGQEILKTDGEVLELKWIDSKVFIKNIRKPNPICPINITFIPPFPNVITLENNKMLEGLFQISCDDSLGLIIGRYQVVKRGRSIKIKCTPSEGWSPVPEKISLRFLYKRSSVFKNWSKSYEWTGYIYERSNLNYYMHSRWKKFKQ